MSSAVVRLGSTFGDTWGELTLVWPRDEPQAAVVEGGILQGDPQPHNSAQGLRVQKWGILMWRH